MSSSITQLAPLLPSQVNGEYDVIPIVSVGEIAPNGSMGVTHKITVENLAYVIGSSVNPEIIMDTVAAHLVGGTGIAIVYDDLNDLLTISNTYTPPVGLLKVDNPLSATLQTVKDGANTSSALQISTNSVTNYGGGSITTNTAFGRDALLANTTASNNTAIGTNAMYSNVIGANNTSLGASTLYFNTASNNTAVGKIGRAHV